MRCVRVVLDTNILVGALISKGTPPDHLYRAWLRGDIEVVTSTIQLAKLADVLARPRLRRFLHPDEATVLVGNLETRAHVLRELPTVRVSPDPDDNPILATAVAGQADFIVSGDKKHVLALGNLENIPIVTAREAWRRITDASTAGDRDP